MMKSQWARVILVGRATHRDSHVADPKVRNAEHGGVDSPEGVEITDVQVAVDVALDVGRDDHRPSPAKLTGERCADT